MDNLLRGAAEDDFAAGGAAVGAEVDNPVGLGDEFEAVLDDDDGVPLADEAAQEREQQFDVLGVEAGGGLVEDVEAAAACRGGGR